MEAKRAFRFPTSGRRSGLTVSMGTAALNKQRQMRGQGPEDRNKEGRKVFYVEKQRNQRPLWPGTKPPDKEKQNKNWPSPEEFREVRIRGHLLGETEQTLLGAEASMLAAGPGPPGNWFLLMNFPK